MVIKLLFNIFIIYLIYLFLVERKQERRPSLFKEKNKDYKPDIIPIITKFKKKKNIEDLMKINNSMYIGNDNSLLNNSFDNIKNRLNDTFKKNKCFENSYQNTENNSNNLYAYNNYNAYNKKQNKDDNVINNFNLLKLNDKELAILNKHREQKSFNLDKSHVLTKITFNKYNKLS